VSKHRVMYRIFHDVKPLCHEAEMANILRGAGYKINRARLTIKPGLDVKELTLDERRAYEVLRVQYHFLVLPKEDAT
jgi:hypothetical protein